MSETIRDQLAGVTISALETAAFMFADPVDAADLDDPDFRIDRKAPFALATVDVVEPVRGSFALRCPVALLPMLASNMMGEDSVDSETLHRDALGEMANVVCGAILPMVYPEARFRLKAPVVVVEDGRGVDNTDLTMSVIRTYFSVDGFLLEGILTLPKAAGASYAPHSS